VLYSLADLLAHFEHIPGGFSWHSNQLDDLGGILEVEISRGLLNIAEGLLFLQNVQRRLHLSISPESIVVTPGGMWKLCGFGFSLAFHHDEYQIASPYFFHNSNSANKGIRLEPDLNYSAPELSQGGGSAIRYVSAASDFYSLGLVAFETYRYNLKYLKEGKKNFSTLLNIKDNNLNQHQAVTAALLSSLDMTAIPNGVSQLVLGMLQVSPTSRISPNDIINNSYFHSGPIAILRSLDHMHTRDIGSQASQLSALPAQISTFPPRILEATILPAIGRVCCLQPPLWVYALPLYAHISERVALPAFQRVAGPAFMEGLAVTHPPETMTAFIKHLNLILDKFDLEFFRVHVVRLLGNCIDKPHPPLQVRPAEPQLIPALMYYCTVVYTLAKSKFSL